MILRLRTPAPEGVTIHFEPACPRPPDWACWRDAALGGAPQAPPAPSCTFPEGWPLTLVEVATAGGSRVHAFYAVFELAVHAWADLPAAAPHEQRAGVRAAFTRALPVWPDEVVVALAQL